MGSRKRSVAFCLPAVPSRALLLALLLTWVGGVPCLADTLNVPQDFLTIQAAVDFAADGDSIVVGPGTYRENVLVYGKSLSISSTNGRDVTIIDGATPTRPDTLSVIAILGAESYLIDGFTLRHGGGTNITDVPPMSGGGICLLSGSGEIRNCTIIDNNCDGHGAGVYLAVSQAVIKNCIIRNNTSLSEGGGIASLLSSPRIEHCTIASNHAEIAGALLLQVGTFEVMDCMISGNVSANGFGLYVGDATVARTVIVDNTGPGCLAMASGSIESCTIVGNHGLRVVSASGTMSRTIIAENEGEAMFCDPTLQVECCDFFGNAGGDVQCGTDVGGNFSLDPLLCQDYSIANTSPCAPENSPGQCGLIGALPVNCTAAVEASTWGRIKAGPQRGWREGE